MKRFLSILLLLTLLLTGCAQEPVETTPSTTATTTQPETEPVTETTQAPTVETTLTPVYTQQPLFAVSVPAVREYLTADDNSVIFRLTYQSMRLVMQDADVADAIILDYLNRVDRASAAGTGIKSQAETDSAGNAFRGPYLCDTLYSPTRIDSSVLSLYGTSVLYSGSSHPDYSCFAANYNMITGDVLTLGSILTHTDSVDTLCDLTIEQLDAMAEEYFLYDDYREVARMRFAGEESYDEDWYFSSGGLCFFFPHYEIAPYTSGIITVEIPYEKLSGIVDDAFFPPERDMSLGQVLAVRGSEADTSQFTQIAEISVDQGGEKIFLFADGAVQDLRMDVGSWDDSGNHFTAEYTCFAASTLTPGDAIALEAFIPDTMPNLRLTYRSGEQTVCIYISQSGEDGSIILVTE